MIHKKENIWYLAAFAIPFFLCLLICIADGVYPFGNKCILHVDMYHQYCPFFMEFLDKLQNGDSLMYSWVQGMGADFVALYAYYLASPLNWLLILWPKEYVIEFMTLTILIKIGLCGSFFFFFLEQHFGLRKERVVRRDLLTLIALVFSATYAMSGFVAAYSWDIMWMDCVALTPLILVGLERLVKQGKPGLYYVSLAICIWSNYYLSIMVCLFLCCYFIYLFIKNSSSGIAAWIRFAVYSILAGGTSAVLLLPEMRVLSYSGSSGFAYKGNFEWYFDFFEEIARGCAFVEPYMGTSHWPNLYAGSFSLFLVGIYLLQRKTSVLEKVMRVGAVIFFLLSFSQSFLDYIWHGLHFPDSLPGRQSFLYILVLLVIGFDVLRNWRKVDVRLIPLVILGWAVIFATSYDRVEESITGKQALVITGLLIAVYGILLMLYRIVGKKFRVAILYIALIVGIGEITANMTITGFYTLSRDSYLRKTEDYEALIEDAQMLNTDCLFYRMEITERMTKNDSSRYMYQSATQFSSLMDINVSHFNQKIGMEGGKNFYSYNGATPLSAALYSVKYMISDSNKESGPLRKLVSSNGEQYLYENRYALPLGFMIPSDVNDTWDLSGQSKVEHLNALARALGAEADLLTYAFMEQEEFSLGQTQVTAMADGVYYASYQSCISDNIKVSSYQGWGTKYSKASHRYLLELGEVEQDGTVVLQTSKPETVEYTIYRLNMDVMDDIYEKLSSQTMDMESYSSTNVKGTITVTEPGDLFFSIPAQEGWSAYVDGVRVEYGKLYDAFITIPLEAGIHEIELRYRTPLLLEGAAISLGCVGIFIFLMWMSRRSEEKKHQEIE